MMNCKAGYEWFNTHPHRARANNSAVLIRTEPDFKKKLESVVRRCFANGTGIYVCMCFILFLFLFINDIGEPGIFLTNDPDYGTNPCAEISLRSKQMCNLTEVNAHACTNREDFLSAVESATIIGTLQVYLIIIIYYSFIILLFIYLFEQASYTDFPYIQAGWAENCRQEALLGVSITGTAQNWKLISEPGLLDEAALVAKRVNEEWVIRL
jgi:ribonucleoside-diphosphate reductase alpha chain